MTEPTPARTDLAAPERYLPDRYVLERYVIDCPACCLVSAAYARIGEVEQLAGVHDDLLHRGRPTAVVRELELAEEAQQ